MSSSKSYSLGFTFKSMIKHLFQSQWYETTNQLQEENWKKPNTWRLNSMLLNNQWVNEKTKGNKKYLNTNENGNSAFQIYAM